jgi:hypothetical protein
VPGVYAKRIKVNEKFELSLEGSAGVPTRPIQALPELLDEFAIEPVVSAEGHLAGQPAFARPARNGVGRHAKELRNVRSGQEGRRHGL